MESAQAARRWCRFANTSRRALAEAAVVRPAKLDAARSALGPKIEYVVRRIRSRALKTAASTAATGSGPTSARTVSTAHKMGRLCRAGAVDACAPTAAESPSDGSCGQLNRQALAARRANQEVLVVECKNHLGERNIEVDVEPTDSRAGAGLLPIGNGRGRRVESRVVRSRGLAAEIEQRDGLDLPVGRGGECGLVSANDQLLLVTERRRGEIVHALDRHRATFERDAHPGPVEIARSAFGGSPQEENASAPQKLGEHAGARLPGDVGWQNYASHRLPEHRSKTLERARWRRRVEKAAHEREPCDEDQKPLRRLHG